MNKYAHLTAKVLLSLLLFMPIIGTFGLMPAPTRDMYMSDTSFEFIKALMTSGYIMPIMALCFAAAVVLLWTKREAAATLLILPFTVNIVAFHLVLDGGLFTPGAMMADVLLLLQVYFLYQSCDTYKKLFAAKQ